MGGHGYRNGQRPTQAHTTPALDPAHTASPDNAFRMDQLNTAQCNTGHHQQADPFGMGFPPAFDLGDWMNQPQRELPELQTPAIIGEMADVAAMSDGAERNLAITQMYHQTSNMLDQAIFADPEQQGQTANWNTFAVWASNEAGRAIRGEGNWVMDVGNFLGEWDPTGIMGNQMSGTQAALANGNREVFAEIAPASAMFAANFGGDAARDPEKFEAFTEWMRTEAPNRDDELGNEGLITAFSTYYDAMVETDPDRQQELMLAANAMIGQHEQSRLQPYIEDAMPWGARGVLTDLSMTLNVPTNERGPAGLDFDQNYESLSLDGEVRDRSFWTGAYQQDYPTALQVIDDRGVQNIWEQVEPDWDSNYTVGAENWADYDDRMTYIGELFRSNQNNERLFNEPFTEQQAQDKLAERN